MPAGSAPRVVVLDYGSGNVHSAVKALERAGADVELTGDRAAAFEADGLLLPGVGAYRHVMEQATARRVGELVGRRLAGGRPVLGICVGMQILFEAGLEGADREEGADRVEGLGEWPGEVTRLEAPVLPHMGWSAVESPEGSVLFDGLAGERFYFVHSYAARDLPIEPHPAARPIFRSWTTYGERFLAAAENGPLSATQFHPEKSGDAGIQLLENWVRSLR